MTPGRFVALLAAFILAAAAVFGLAVLGLMVASGDGCAWILGVGGCVP